MGRGGERGRALMPGLGSLFLLARNLWTQAFAGDGSSVFREAESATATLEWQIEKWLSGPRRGLEAHR